MRSPSKDLKELIAYAKANPGKVNAGTPGNGSLGQLASELLQQHTGTKMTHVPYRGSAPVMTDLVGGQINVAFDFMPTYIPLVNDGKVRPLAVTSSARMPGLPDVMTVQEAGFPGFEATGWFAIVAPTGTPADAIAKINAIANAWLNSPKGKAQLELFAMQAAGGTPDDLKAYIRTELDQVGADHQGGEDRDVTRPPISAASHTSAGGSQLASIAGTSRSGAPRAVCSPPPCEAWRGGVGGGGPATRRVESGACGNTPHPDPSPPRATRVGGGERTARGAFIGANITA